MPILAIIILIVSIFLLILLYLKKKKVPQHTYMILKIVLIVILLESTIFNMNSYRTMFKNYEKKEYNFDNLNIENLEYNEEKDTYTATDTNWYSVEIDNINTEIATLKINAESVNVIDAIEYYVLYTDKTSANYRGFETRSIMKNNDKSRYSTYFLSGESEKITINMYLGEGIEYKFDTIQINEPIPFEFNFIRVDILILVALFIYGICNLEIFNKQYNSKSQRSIICTIVGVFIIISIFMVLSAGEIENNELYSKELIQALENGQVYLLENPSQELIEMDNPYDFTEIRTENIDVKHDAAYYNGKYYVYFGILPALILFLPYKLITGSYLTANIGVLIFSILSIISLTKLLCLVWKKWFSNHSFKILILELITLLSGSLIFWVQARPMMYEIALTSGMFFVVLGVYFILKSSMENKSKYTNICIRM